MNQLTATERFRRFLSGEPVDRSPAVEWAHWWRLTTDRWHKEGLPAEYSSFEEIQAYFGLDILSESSVSYQTAETPRPAGHGLGIMETEADWERIRKTFFPPVKSVIADGYFDWLHKTREEEDRLHRFVATGAFWFPRELFGIENHLYSFYDYPELYARICDELADWYEEAFDYIFPRFRFDFMSFAEDMSYNHGSMLSKDCFDACIAPFYRRLIPIVHKYDIPVFIDSDGDITETVDWYAEVGADGMFPLERQVVDVSKYLDKQPGMAFLGHFDKMCMKFGEDTMNMMTAQQAAEKWNTSVRNVQDFCKRGRISGAEHFGFGVDDPC